LLLLSVLAHPRFDNTIDLIFNRFFRFLVSSLLSFLLFQLNCMVQHDRALLTTSLVTFEVLSILVVSRLSMGHHVLAIHRVFKLRLPGVHRFMVNLELKLGATTLSLLNSLCLVHSLVSADRCESRIQFWNQGHDRLALLRRQISLIGMLVFADDFIIVPRQVIQSKLLAVDRSCEDLRGVVHILIRGAANDRLCIEELLIELIANV